MYDLTVRVLGTFEVAVDRRVVALTAGRLRTLLAVLAMSAGKVLPMDHLAAVVWGERLPGNARRSLQTYAGRLRAILGGVRIESAAAGLALHTDPDNVDALRFVRLLDEAGHQPTMGAERARLGEALDLWRGEPYEGVSSEWLHENHAPGLVERYLSALERRIDIDLADGRHRDLEAEVRELIARHPLRESLWVRLLVALGQSGRHAEALEAYEAVRKRIVAELGVDPGPDLRRVHAELVAGVAPAVAHDVVPPTRPGMTPQQLPPDIDCFAGRRDQLAALDGLIAGGSGMPSATVCVITGTAGVGKTTLAVRWARRAAVHFPDGQLHANLQGYGPSKEATEPTNVLRGFLDAFNVPLERIPDNVAARTALLRSLLADKRVLVLLDNARDAEQVRPLLPSSRGCLAVITSRNDLAGLVVAEGARPVSLDVLSPDESRQLLAVRLGEDRVVREPAAVRAIIGSCARLPLALAIVAARATLNPSLPLGELAADLRDSRDELDILETGDDATSVRAVFSWSHRLIAPETARLFRLLGMHPSPEMSVAAAASLAECPVPRARALLVRLHRANLVDESGRDRYRMHDLLWAYARELVAQQHNEEERHAAVCRLLDHYTATAFAAERLLDPLRDPITAPNGGPVAEPSDKHGAFAWFATERQTLLAACKQAADHGSDRHVYQLAWALTTFLDRHGLWHDWAWIQRAALEAAERLGGDSEIAHANRILARASTRLRRYADANKHFTRAVDLYRALGDPVGQATTHINLGWMYECQEDFATALHHNELALELFERSGHEVGQAKVLNAIGWDYTKLGDHRTALTYCERALRLNEDLDDRFGQAETWDSLGYVHLHLSDHKQSIVCYEHAIALHVELGMTVLMDSVLRDMGDAHRASGDLAAARACYAQSLELMEEQGHPGADELRARLRSCAEEENRAAG
jgi:DNA-binding SARP family transcriptional activator/tetratricopeptide (TPR) repeat protein